MENAARIQRVLKPVASLALFAVFCWMLLEFIDLLGGIDGVKQRYGEQASVVLFLMMMAPPVPSEPFGAAIASLQGFFMGGALYWSALIIRSTIEYGGGRFFLSDALAHTRKSVLPDRLKDVPLHHPAFLISGRWVPLGNHIVSVVAGAGRVHLGRYVVLTAIGTLPLAIIVSGVASGVVWAHG